MVSRFLGWKYISRKQDFSSYHRRVRKALEAPRLPPVNNQIVNASCITEGEVHFVRNEKYVKIHLAAVDIDPISIIIELTFENELKDNHTH